MDMDVKVECGMVGVEAQIPLDLSQWASGESLIYDALTQTAQELAHAECFDEEQRAEIYAILQAIKSDTANHRQMVEMLARKLQRGCANA
jgi:hypothetical protein